MSSKTSLQAQNKTAVKSASVFRQAVGAFEHTPAADTHAEELYQGVDHDFGKIKVYSDNRMSAPPMRLQAKLMVNQHGDQYEQEADAMADRVINMSQSPRLPMREAAPAAIQRKCNECEQEEDEQAAGPSVMRKAEGGGGFQASPALTSQLATTKGGGTPLPVGTRSFMENAFSTDFSRVRIHTNGQAAGMNREVSARAFTHGSDIYFNRGEYDPQSREGKKLLAHELAHVLQQRNAHNDFKIQRQPIANDLRRSFSPGFSQEKLWEAISHSGCIQSFFGGVVGAILGILLFMVDLLFLLIIIPGIVPLISAFLASAAGVAFMAFFNGFMLGLIASSITTTGLRFYSRVERATSSSELWAAGDDLCREMGEALINLGLWGLPYLRPLIPSRIMNFFSRARISSRVNPREGAGAARQASEPGVSTQPLAVPEAEVIPLDPTRSPRVRSPLRERSRELVTPIERARLRRGTRTPEPPRGEPSAVEEQLELPHNQAFSTEAIEESSYLQTGTDSTGPVASRGGSRRGTPPTPSESPRRSTGTSTGASTRAGRRGRAPRRAGRTTSYPQQIENYIEQLIERFARLRTSELRPLRRGPGQGMFEERMRTGGGGFSFRAKLSDGRRVQIDDIRPDGVITELKMRYVGEDGLILEQRNPEALHTLEDQMQRQSQFISENGLPPGEWQTNNSELYEILVEIRAQYGIRNILPELIE